MKHVEAILGRAKTSNRITAVCDTGRSPASNKTPEYVGHTVIMELASFQKSSIIIGSSLSMSAWTDSHNIDSLWYRGFSTAIERFSFTFLELGFTRPAPSPFRVLNLHTLVAEYQAIQEFAGADEMHLKNKASNKTAHAFVLRTQERE
jgi:hypothetical protein